MTFHPDSLPSLSGKVYIVTGGTAGIGYYTVARLAQRGAHVYLCARSEAKGQKAIEGIQSLYPNSNLSVLVMDHMSLPTVVAAANLFLTKETALHGLVNNAGIMATPFELTEHGYEAHWQINYIAHWLLTSHLLPLLLETSKTLPAGSVRIVNLTSGGHMSAPKPGIDFEDTSLAKANPITRYGQSKLANILHAKTLNKRYGPGSSSAKNGKGEIWTSSVHPGIVESELDDRALEMPWFMTIASGIAQAIGARWPTDKGAWTPVFCAASPEMKPEQSGEYFERIAKTGGMLQSAKSKDLELAEKLERWVEAEMKKQGYI
ncbi:unnamed protein product [Clonostachys rosea f. rosea IK726]|uniref:NAD(P)-binding protein n=2 Tax=Bionectria ochroleuca TaxID=29856 RepID=A0A0B7KIK4_BIOOC|nr:unnamed protein product [Clonostachys rosea f. rosea IK726]